MSQTYNLGKVAITPRGAYSSTTQYTPLDILSYNGSSYLVLQNCMGVTPPNATYYMVVASKGDTGSAGASPTIAAGTVTMTPAGTSASVTNVGTNVNASFNFTLPNGNVIYTGTGVTGTSTTPTVFSGSGVSNAGVGDIYINTSTVAFYRCAVGGAASTAKWAFLTYAVPSGSVTTAKIADSAVTRNKIADGAIGTDEIADGTVSSSKLGSDVTTTLANKANIDGSYEGMTVGNAEQLVSTVGVSDNAPYTFRTTGGSADVGDRMNLKAVVGGTVAWNQLVQNGNFVNSDNWNWRQTGGGSVSNNEASLVALSANNNQQISQNISFIANHKYFVRFDVRTGGSSNTLKYGLYTSLTEKLSKSVSISSSKASISGIFVPTENCDNLRFGFVVPAVNDTAYFSSVNCYDLTAMFGTAIADYVYTLESGTAGSGIAWLKKYGWFTKPYYPHAAASLESVKTSAHKTYGFNAYDNTTGKAKVVGGMVYQITGAYTALSLDGTSITPDASGYFTPSVSGELTVTGGNDTTTCIHLKWDGERDGEYEPYEQHTYALDDVELRGILKLDASNNLYYDGDTYEADGTVTRNYGIVDLGTLSWEKPTATDYMNFYSNGIASVVKCPSSTADGNKDIRCSKYSSVPITALNDNYIYITASDGQIRIKDTANASLTAAAFKTAMSGVYLVYELATPTTESADPYTELQICSDWGVEEFVDATYAAGNRDFEMPCGNNAIYAPNLRAKLEMSPNSPDAAGDFIVRQTDGTNEYVPVSDNSIISGLSTRCPSCPTDTDGNFVLKAVVSSGTVTYSWVSA